MDRAAYNAAIDAAYRTHTVDAMVDRAFVRYRAAPRSANRLMTLPERSARQRIDA
jgi:hypothetical protein